MAHVVIRNNQKELIGQEAVSDYLNQRGLIYQFWDTDRIKGRLKDSYHLDANEQKELLNSYEPEIQALRSTQGYITEDVIVLSPETPNLETILAKFDREHHHTDDEVRFIVDGSGVFTICQEQTIFDVVVGPGDLFVVPAFTRHWFTLTDERKIKCIRIFKDSSGWVAIYDQADNKAEGRR